MGRDHHRYHTGHLMTTNPHTTPTTTSKLTGTGLGGSNNSREGDTGRGPQLPSPESNSSHHQTSSTTLSSTSSSSSSTVATGSTTTPSANHGSSLFDHPHPHTLSHSHSQHPHHHHHHHHHQGKLSTYHNLSFCSCYSFYHIFTEWMYHPTFYKHYNKRSDRQQESGRKGNWG
jgi:hypothetical protein